MVLENLTLFEVHLENARIGPNRATASNPEGAAEDASGDREETVDDTADGGPSIGRLVVASVLLSVVVSVLAWKLASDDEDPEVAIDAPAETDEGVDVTVEE
ncbi:MAG: hypothetical protein ACOCPZ_04115 [Natrialbaceae archaeon]